MTSKVIKGHKTNENILHYFFTFRTVKEEKRDRRGDRDRRDDRERRDDRDRREDRDHRRDDRDYRREDNRDDR